jgi:alpha amylase, catalytic domain
MTKSWRDVNAIYQIYPRSFKDTNGDGVGDLRGIIEKIDYLKGEDKSLGVDAIWLSPIFSSPQIDCGYDISDYRSIDPLFGGMAMFDELLLQAHKRDLKVMLDLVPNHSSDQHAWFKESSSSRDNSKRDYYIWRDAKSDGTPPNNWLSMSGGSAWQWHDKTGQYYLHSFLPSQPDLNWDNPEVRQEIFEIMRFWFEKGVDGFRVDAIWPLSKNFAAGDNPRNPEYYAGDEDYGSYIHQNSKGGPKLCEYLRMMSDVALEYKNKFLVYEFYPDDRFGSRFDQYSAIQKVAPGVSSTFYFEAFQTEWWARKFQEKFNAFGTWYDQLPVASLGNHDQTRIVSKFGMAQAKALALMQLSLPGIPAIYYGDELGMLDVDIPQNYKHDNFAGGAGMDARDKYRTPMRWSADILNNAGFSNSNPWLPIGDNLDWLNVESEQNTDHSFFNLYKKMLTLRSEYVALRYGEYSTWQDISDDIMTFKRNYNDEIFYILINFTDRQINTNIPSRGRVVASTNTTDEYDIENSLMLNAFEAILVKAYQ